MLTSFIILLGYLLFYYFIGLRYPAHSESVYFFCVLLKDLSTAICVSIGFYYITFIYPQKKNLKVYRDTIKEIIKYDYMLINDLMLKSVHSIEKQGNLKHVITTRDKLVSDISYIVSVFSALGIKNEMESKRLALLLKIQNDGSIKALQGMIEVNNNAYNNYQNSIKENNDLISKYQKKIMIKKDKEDYYIGMINERKQWINEHEEFYNGIQNRYQESIENVSIKYNEFLSALNTEFYDFINT